MQVSKAQVNRINLRFTNNLLTVVVIIVGVYIALIPFLPTIQFWFSKHGTVPYGGKLAQSAGQSVSVPIPKDNRLVIPSINMNEGVKEGLSISTINNNGVWRRPGSSDSPNKGNMVLVGHRFLYTNPYGTFYHLDKVKTGDKIALYWQGKEYIYEISQVKVTDANDQTVEQPTDEAQLTLYTCTPLLTAKDRLVLIAKRIEQ